MAFQLVFAEIILSITKIIMEYQKVQLIGKKISLHRILCPHIMEQIKTDSLAFI